VLHPYLDVLGWGRGKGEEGGKGEGSVFRFTSVQSYSCKKGREERLASVLSLLPCEKRGRGREKKKESIMRLVVSRLEFPEWFSKKKKGAWPPVLTSITCFIRGEGERRGRGGEGEGTTGYSPDYANRKRKGGTAAFPILLEEKGKRKRGKGGGSGSYSAVSPIRKKKRRLERGFFSHAREGKEGGGEEDGPLFVFVPREGKGGGGRLHSLYLAQRRRKKGCFHCLNPSLPRKRDGPFHSSCPEEGKEKKGGEGVIRRLIITSVVAPVLAKAREKGKGRPQALSYFPPRLKRGGGGGGKKKKRKGGRIEDLGISKWVRPGVGKGKGYQYLPIQF